MAEGTDNAGGAGGGAADAGGTGGTQTPAANWYDGKASAEEVGLWQNKNWGHADPVQVALAATKAYNEAQKFVGAPTDELLRLPKNPVAPEWQNVWERLGVPKDATGYDLSAIKRADGTALDAQTEQALRGAALKAHVPASAAGEFVQDIVKHLDGVALETASAAAAALEVERTALRQNWGNNYNINLDVAKRGAEALGLDNASLLALEKSAGYAKTMEAMRRVGVLNKEDGYVAGSVPGNAGIMTRDAASARMAELKNDRAWTGRLMAGEVAARREFDNLSLIIAGT